MRYKEDWNGYNIHFVVRSFEVWPRAGKNIDNFVFLMSQRKIGQDVDILSYLLNGSMKSLHSFFCWKGNILQFSFIYKV